LNDFIFAEFGENELDVFTSRLVALQNRLEKARLKLILDI
jgi:hypothetical protein